MAQSSFRSLWPWPGTILLTLLCAWLVYMGSIADVLDVRTAFYGMAFVTGIAVLLGIRYAFIRDSLPSLTPQGAARGEFESRATSGTQHRPPERSRFDAPRRSMTGEVEGMDLPAAPADDGMPRNARMRAAAANSRSISETDPSPAQGVSSDTADTGDAGEVGQAADGRKSLGVAAAAEEATPAQTTSSTVVDSAPRTAPELDGIEERLSDQFQASLAREKADRGAALAQLSGALTARLDAVDKALDDIKAAAAAATGQGLPPDALAALSTQVERVSAAVDETADLRETVQGLAKQREDLTALSERVAALSDQGGAATPAPKIEALEKRLEGVLTIPGFNNILNTKLLPTIDARIVERLDNAITPEALKAKLGDAAPADGDSAGATTIADVHQRLDAMEREGAEKVAAIQRDIHASLNEAKAALAADIRALRDNAPTADSASQSALSSLQARLDVGDRAVAEIRDGLSAVRSALDGAAANGGGGTDTELRNTLDDLSARLSAVEAAATAKTVEPVRDAVAVLQARVNTGLSDASGAVNTLRTGLSDLAQNVTQMSEHYTALLQRVDQIGAALANSGPAPSETNVQGEMDTLREQLLTIIEQNREIRAQQQQISETFAQPARIEFGRAK